MKRGLAVSALVVATALSCFAGATYTFTTLTEAEGAKSATRTRVWASGGSLKMLFVQSDEPTTPVSSYVLRPTRASALYLVDPQNRTYFRWDPEQALHNDSSKFQVLDARFERVSETRGGTVAGFATTHYLFRLSYTMRSDVFGQEADTPVTIDQEYWVADDLRLSDIRSANLMQSQTAALSQLGPELQRTIAAETAKLKGTALKTVMSFVVRLPAREQRTTMTSEISDIKTVAVPPAIFRIPRGYRRVAPKLAEVDDDTDQH